MEIKKGPLGQFFFFIGAIVLVVFFTAGEVKTPLVVAFFVGVLLTVLGLVLMTKGKTSPPPSGRFRIIRSMREKSKKNQKPAADKRN